jgi:ComF family protein
MILFKRYLKALSDLLLPRRCAVCGRALYVDENHLCLYCLADMPLTRFWTMERNPMADRFNAVVQKGLEKAWEDAGLSIGGHERYAFAVALFFYDSENGYRQIPYRLKYHGDIRIGKHFGKMLGRKLKETSWADTVDALVPVPLHWRRKWTRGYNQAEVIASAIAAVLDIPVRTNLLKRVRHTRTQTQLETAEKENNVRNAFAVTPGSDIPLRHILLVDDVFTTGSTVGACFAALRAVFPPEVRLSVATLAFVGEV